MSTPYLIKLPETVRRLIKDSDMARLKEKYYTREASLCFAQDCAPELEDTPQCTLVFGEPNATYEQLLQTLATQDARESSFWSDFEAANNGDKFHECPTAEYVDFIACSEVMQRGVVEISDEILPINVASICGSFWCGKVSENDVSGSWGVITGPKDPWFGDRGASYFWQNVKNDCHALDS